MSSNLLKQLDRIELIRDQLHSKIIRFAKQQAALYQKLESEITGKNVDHFYSPYIFDYLIVGECGEIQCWRDMHAGDDEQSSEFRINTSLMDGDPGPFIAETSEYFTKITEFTNKNKVVSNEKRIAELQEELARLTAITK